eukprot:CAMPEP_0183761182 /NCGR_PEP_ID=MMETSP0739-20130205/8261_1 /TAXON_ID=385413 /ORGANISM="Thalassiosira miniscula, Strain CCMP1093" /LENGTH=400 /DNA_ID=CAMNT_0025999283 /DNA_START=15 /DNA_END=1217 /DNA_ORIENTATION=+
MGNACLSTVESYSMYYEGRCTYTDFLTRLDLEIQREAPDCPWGAVAELRLLLNGTVTPGVVPSEDEAKSHIEDACQAALDAQPQFGWGDVTKKAARGEPLFDSIYYDGGSIWNEQYETLKDNRVPYVDGKPANVLKHDGSRIDDVYEAYAQEGKIEYADSVVDNFADCPLRATMCCFASDRQANDNNGNCAKPYDQNCVDADPADNTDLCYVDMSRDKSASGTDGGFSIYPGDNADGEGPVHCHGFAWSNDPSDPSSRYRGNNLFYVSMYDHLYTRGYVRNFPGAPMCACLDRMPVVSRSDCTQVDVTELWVATFKPADGASAAPSFSLGLDVENGVSIKFNACRGAVRNNDLESYYHRLFNEGRASVEELTEVRETLVGNGNCQSRIDQFVTTQGFEKI